MQSPSSIRPPLPSTGSSSSIISQAGGQAAGAGQAPKDFPFPPLSGTNGAAGGSSAAPIPLSEPRIQPLSFRIPLLQHRNNPASALNRNGNGISNPSSTATTAGAASGAASAAGAATATSTATATATATDNPELDRLKALKEQNMAGLHLSHSSPSTAPTPVMQATLVTSETWKIRWACFVPANSATAASPTTSMGRDVMYSSLSYSSTLQPPSASSFSAHNAASLSAFRRPMQSTTHSAATTPNDPSTPSGSHLNLKSSRTRLRADSSVSTGSRKRPRTSAVSPFATQAHAVHSSNPHVSRLLHQMKLKDDVEPDAMLAAREQFLSDLDSCTSGSRTESPATGLPSKLAYIDVVPSPEGTPFHMRLWLFTLVVDQDMDADVFGSFAGLEMHLSGTFAHQDLFPSLYNDNSIYIAPSSRPCRNFASCLQLAAATNQDAINASVAFSSAVSNYLLEDTKEHCHPQGVGPGARCGSRILWPSTESHTPGLSLSYDLHYDFDGIVAIARLELCHQRALLPSARALDANLCLTKDDPVVLCPLAIETRFVRIYGKSTSNASSKKQALCEAGEIPTLKTAFLRLLQGKQSASPGSGLDEIGDEWVVCSYDDTEIVWPASFSLLGPKLDAGKNSNHRHPVHKGETNSRRFRASTGTRSLQSFRKLSEQLAVKTSMFIDKAAKDRERERRERAEKAIAANAANNSNPGHSHSHSRSHSQSQPFSVSATPAATSTPPLPNASPIFGGSPANFAGYFTPADSSIMSPAYDSPTTAPMVSGTDTKVSGSAQPGGNPTLNMTITSPSKKPAGNTVDDLKIDKRSRWAALGKPVTLASLVAQCPTPSRSIRVPASTTQPPPAAGINSFQLSEHTAGGNTKDSTVYPTPQSTNTVGSTTSEQVNSALVTSSTSNLPQAEASVNARPSSNSFNDMFDDFLWTSYPSTDISYHAESGRSRQNNTDLGESNDPFSFADSDMGIFDSGLTEDDFSFFDTPALPSAASMRSLPDQIAVQPLNPGTLPTAPHTAPQLPTSIDFSDFITSQGAIDHFGHLMPTGNSPGSGSVLSITSPNFVGGEVASNSVTLSMPNHVSLHDVPGSNQRQSPDSPSFAFSSNEFMITPEQQSARSQDGALTFSPVEVRSTIQDSSRTPFNNIVEIVEGDDEHLPPKYFVSPARQHPGNSPDSVRRAVHHPKYAPVRFGTKLPTPRKLLTAGDNSAETTDVSKPEDLLARQKRAKAAALRAYLTARSTQSTPSEKKLYRNWSSLQDLASLPFEDTSSSSSSEESDDEEPGGCQGAKNSWSSQAPPEARKMLGPSLLVLTGTFEKEMSVRTEEMQPSAATPADKSKLSRNEREALVTVFFQQYLENPDMRERVTQSAPSASQQHDCSAASDMLGLGQAPLAFPLVFRPQSAQRTIVSVYYHSAVMRMSSTALSFWKKMGLRPHSGEKDVHAYILAPSSLVTEGTKGAVLSWFDRLAKTYKVCGLGEQYGGSKGTEEYNDLLHILDCADKTLSQVTDIQDKLQALGTQIIRDATSDSHTIIYILVTDEECRRPNSLVVQLCLRLHLLKRGLIPHLVPLSMVSRQAVTLDPSTSSHRTIFSRLAFTVYDRLPVLLQRHVTKRLLQLTVEGSNPTSALQATRVCPAPAFRLVPHTKSSINFTLQWPASSLDILDRHRLFHIAYSISADGRWLFLAAIDERAEYHTLRVRFVEGLEPKLVLKRVWNYAKEVTEPVNVEWRISIAKAGVMPVAEVQTWNDLLQSCVRNLARAAVVTVSSIGPLDDSVLNEPADGSTPTSTKPDSTSSGPKPPPLPDMVCGDHFSCPKLTISKHPTPVYDSSNSHGASADRPGLRVPLYSSLSTATVRYGPKVAAHDFKFVKPSQVEGFSLNMLLTASHPSSTYVQPLSRHIQDVMQSFVDLHVIARERWSLPGRHGDLGGLPWHLAAVTLITTYDIESLFPAA